MAGAVASRNTTWMPTRQVTSTRSAAAHRTTLAIVAGMTIVSLVVRLAHIDYQSLWLDEGYTLLFSGMPLSKLLTVGGAHEHPPLYYLLVHLVLHLHHSYLVPRFISALAGSLSIPVLYAVGARMFDRRVGVVAAGFLAISPFHFWFSDDGRAYELAGLFVLLSYLLLFRVLDRPGVGLWVAYGASLAACLYTEYTTVLVLVPQGLLLVRARPRGLGRSLLLAWGGAALSFVPWLPVWLHNASTVSDNYWIPNPTWSSLQSVMLEMLGLKTTCPSAPCTGHVPPLPLLQGHEGLVAGVAAAAILVTLLWAVAGKDLPVSVVALWLVLPFAIILLLSLHRSLYLDRVFLDATFGLYLLMGWWLMNALQRRPLIPVALVLAIPVVGALMAFHATYSDVTNADWKSASRDFQAAYRTGQSVVFYPGPVQEIVTAYLPANQLLSLQRPVWFHQYLDVPGWQLRYATATDEELRNMQLAQATTRRRAVWLLAEDYTGLPQARHWLTAHGFYLRLSQLYDGHARIELWDRGTPADFGPGVVPSGFDGRWTKTGNVSLHGSTAAVEGRTSLDRSFAVQPGMAYVANVDYRCSPPAYPLVGVDTMDSTGRSEHSDDPFGTHEARFPRSKWYDWPVVGVWLSQPFGFVTPPDNVRAVLHLRTLWGSCSWRNISVYRER
jgi:mannosyltransferase